VAVTNFGALAILALPRKSGPGESAETRLLIALEAATRAVNERGDRRATVKFLAGHAGLPEITARRARDRCIARGVISYTPGPRGHAATWRFLVSLTPPERSDHLDRSPTAITLGERSAESAAISQVIAGLGSESGSDHLDRSPTAITSAARSDHLGRAPELSTTDNTSLSSTVDRARDDDAQPDWRRGPDRAISPTKIYAPGHGPPGPRSNPRPTPTPPTWTAPRANPAPEIAERGGALARALLADRPRPEGAPPPPPRTEDEWRALARRQVREAHHRREAATVTEPAEHRPPERDLGEPPIPPPPDDEPVIFEPETGEGPPDECPF